MDALKRLLENRPRWLGGRTAVIGVPYLFLLGFFLLPFVIVFKISISEMEVVSFKDLLTLQDGVASGEGPCGGYDSTYVSDGLFITFSAVEGAAADTCGDAGSERALLAGLRSTVRVERDRSALRLIDASGRVALRFTSPTAP